MKSENYLFNNTESQLKSNIESIRKLEKEAINNRSIAEKMAEKITNVAGSTAFIILHIVWFAIWFLLNTKIISGIKPFDAYPFSFLTLVVSLEAIFLTLLVLMSQNRMTQEADKRAHLDLQINILAEQESTITLQIVQRISKHLGLDIEEDEALKELGMKTDVNSLAKKL
jgi:uncharacterized membrane protein